MTIIIVTVGFSETNAYKKKLDIVTSNQVAIFCLAFFSTNLVIMCFFIVFGMEYVHDVFHLIQIDFIARLLYSADRLKRNNRKFKLLFIHLIIIII